MYNFKIEINTWTMAFESPTGHHSNYYEGVELNRILANISRLIEEGYLCGRCIDKDGKEVGKWSRINLD